MAAPASRIAHLDLVDHKEIPFEILRDNQLLINKIRLFLERIRNLDTPRNLKILPQRAYSFSGYDFNQKDDKKLSLSTSHREIIPHNNISNDHYLNYFETLDLSNTISEFEKKYPSIKEDFNIEPLKNLIKNQIPMELNKNRKNKCYKSYSLGIIISVGLVTIGANANIDLLGAAGSLGIIYCIIQFSRTFFSHLNDENFYRRAREENIASSDILLGRFRKDHRLIY